MKKWLGFGIFCLIMWFCASHFGWFDWVNADHGIWYETKQIFSSERIKQKKIENQRKIDRYN